MGQTKEKFMMLREESNGMSFEHLIDAKKSNLQTAVTTIVTAVKEGHLDELRALILAKKGSEFFTNLEKEIRPLAEDAYVYKIGKDYSAHDTKIETAETGVKYDYTACNDPEWNDINTEATLVDGKKKTRETFLKSLQKPLEVVDTETGETYTINPPIKTGKTGLKLTIK